MAMANRATALATASSHQQTLRWASDNQKYLFERGPYPILASGGYGSGKTYAFVIKLLYLLDLYPNSRAVIARKVSKELKETTMRTFFKICLPQQWEKGRRNDNEGVLELNNGSTVLWTHLDNADRIRLLQGLEINFAFFDQAEELDEKAFTTTLARLGRWDQAEVPKYVLREYEATNGPWRWKNKETGRPIPPTFMMLTCNPDTEQHWLYRRFHPDSREWQERWSKRGYQLVHMPSYENKFLPDANLEEMQSNDPAWVRRYVDGEWGYPHGIIHDVPELSLLTTDPLDKRGMYVHHEDFLEMLHGCCSLHRSFDHGDSSPACCLWEAVDSEGNVFFYREYYRDNLLISDHRVNIGRLAGQEKYASQLADPSIFHEVQGRHGQKWCVAKEYSDRNYDKYAPPVHWQPADNNEMATRNRINEYLRVDPERIHPITHQRGSPRAFFLLASDRYPQGIQYAYQETKAQRRKKVGEVAGKPIFDEERDATIPDHGYDPVRYFMASRPRLGHQHEEFDDTLRYSDIPEMVANTRHLISTRPTKSHRVTGRHPRQRF